MAMAIVGHPLKPGLSMRGGDEKPRVLFSCVDLENRVPNDHPLRHYRDLLDGILRELSALFAEMHAAGGRPSIPPEQLLRALVIQLLYSVRSERQLMEQIDYNLLFRWFVGLGMDDRVWVPTVFSKNRDRLLEGDVARALLAAVVAEAKRRDLVSDDHFTVDGTLMEAWASQKSFPPKDEGPQGRNAALDFQKQKRSNATHESKTDPDARLARKADSQGAKLSYQGNVLVENRHGLVVDAEAAIVTGTSEVDTALVIMDRLPPRERRRTVGADRLYDQQRFVEEVPARNFTPHVAQNATNRRSTIDGRTTRHPGYTESQRRRKLVEQGFRWDKTVGLLRKLRHRRHGNVDWIFTFAAGVIDMVRLRIVHRAGVCSRDVMRLRAALDVRQRPGTTPVRASESTCLGFYASLIVHENAR